ncbi:MULTISPECIES: DMT family transporter [Pseudonocardia]|uniref:Membrane protein n=2 Tax=Pseudonocardia TaxID=1847 RepID=A0ABQ0RUP6_9PSEU|nr:MULTISPECIES: DMT family transporter [Pseudonocardia]OSY42732.1 putative inner membrane transporter YedA [Pseudonocardia autotrophica]TDN77309.1 EamA-like transporter family protein [Pseudonocardia autotrophica]BBG01331.1 membrane protein [Pseudonocardia autotrophica]GEC24387.1 membrane protein [Pseudonocardia saturnea]
MGGRGWALFAAVSVLWGVPYLFIGIALQEGIGPLATAAARVVLALVVLVPIAFRHRHRALLAGRWGRLAVLALVEVVVPFSLIPLGGQTVPSGTSGVLIATEPMFVLVVGLVLGTRARPTLAALIGLVVGFAGVVVLLGVDGSGPGAGLIVTAAACYAVGAVLVGRWFGDLPAMPVVAAMIVLAAPALTALALVSEPLPVPTPAGLAALAALGLVATPGGFVAFFRLIAIAGPDRAALITYVAPVVAVAAGAVLLAEPVGPRMAGGALLVLAGAWLATRGPLVPGGAPRGRPTEPPPRLTSP